MNENIVEWVGYFATAVLMIAFLMKDVRKLRYINTVGCFAFIAYGFLLDISWPIVISNAFIATVNMYYLFIKKD
jgi:uncharacterized membrane protein YjjB (DUF3815 family)